MSSLTQDVGEKFCELCDWTHTVWSIQRTFQDDPRTADIAAAGHGYLFHHLSTICSEYTLLQMSKLHDPAKQQGRFNLTLHYVLEFGAWDPSTEAQLRGVLTELEDLNQRIRGARNRMLAHNDLATILADTPLGDFPTGLDDKYFERLQTFASIVHERTTGLPFQFAPFARTDVFVLLDALSESVAREA